MGKSAVGGAVGVAHDQDAFGLVQTDRHSDLFENEVLFEIIAWRGQGFGSSGDHDHVGALDTLLLQEFADNSVNAVIEAAEHRSVGYVGGGGRVEMEDLAHECSV